MAVGTSDPEVWGPARLVGSDQDDWADRGSSMRCASCMWFVLKLDMSAGDSPGKCREIGRCRRHAPTMSGYPVVFDTDWCGDHKLDERK